MTHDNIYTFEEILDELLKNNDFHSFDQIIGSELNQTYYIIRTPEKATEILLNPQINITTPISYIILSDILIERHSFDKNMNFDGWIFSKSLTFNTITFKNEVNFSNCIFLNKIDFFNVTFMGKVNFDYSTVNIAEFGDVKFCQPISFNRFFVRDRLNIRHCLLESSFYLQYRYPHFNPLKSDLRPIFNFSYSKFHKFFGLHIPNLKRATPIIVMEKTIFLDDIDIDYDELFRYNFKILLFDQKLYIERISDNLEYKLFKVAENKIYYSTNYKIKESFKTLFHYYQSRDIDRMLDSQYFYLKYFNLLNLYRYQDSWIENNIIYKFKFLVSFLFLDLPFKYFTSWKASLRTLVIALFIFFSIFLIFANQIVDGNGKPITTQDFYINFQEPLDIKRIGNVLYFTLITFTTIGYGDFHPTGFLKIVAGIEGLIGILLTSVFTVTLAKRILG